MEAMTGRKDSERVALDRVADALVDDILNKSDEDILAEMYEEGINPDRYAAEMRERFENIVMHANKAKLAAAKAAVSSDQARVPRSTSAPVDMAESRRRLQNTLASSQQQLTLAARNETEMTDSDVLSMLDDLRELGVIPPDNET
jgi:hypothetical protein